MATQINVRRTVLNIKSKIGLPGAKGDTGDTGPQGEIGPQGPQGIPGVGSDLIDDLVTATDSTWSSDKIADELDNVSVDLSGYYTSTQTDNLLSSKSDTTHNHDLDYKDIDYVPSWSEVTSKPTTFTPESHTHLQQDISGLATTLGGKSDTGHTHDDRYFTETEINSAFDGYYSKTEADLLLDDKVDTSYLSLYYTSAEIDTIVADYYTKTETDTLLSSKSDTTHNHTGVYRDNSWVPDWSDVTSKPTFATVATSGSYTDLTSKPTIDTLLPTQTGNTGKFLTTDGSASSWGTAGGGLTNLTESLNTAVPNNSINAVRLIVTTGTTNNDLVLSPKGTGAILAQLPDGTTAGGNKRGANSVDFQMTRTAIDQVAGGTCASILSGGSNKVLANYGLICSGYNNEISRWASATAAHNNYAVIVGGFQNKIGDANGYSGPHGFIGGGASNLIANGINSGYSVVVGGQSNVAQNTYCFVGGGSSNCVSGTYSVIVGGSGNNVSSDRSFIGGGNSNISGGHYSVVVGGSANQCSSDYSVISGGANNKILSGASYFYSWIPGGNRAKTSNYGQGAHSSGNFAAAGDAQHSWLVVRKATTASTNAVTLALDGDATYPTVPVDTTWLVTLRVIGRVASSSGGGSVSFSKSFLASRTSGNATINGVEDIVPDVGVTSTESISITASTGGAITLSVIGTVSYAMRWVGVLDIVEVGYA